MLRNHFSNEIAKSCRAAKLLAKFGITRQLPIRPEICFFTFEAHAQNTNLFVQVISYKEVICITLEGEDND